MNALATLQSHATRIARGNARVKPGEPHRISDAASVGDGVWQGDLGLELVEVDRATIGMTRVDAPTDAHRQLVPGSTQGARHCLDSVDGVSLWLPRGWGESYEGLAGPVFLASRDVTVTHPTHGDVTVPAGVAIACRYQREYDAELRRERRAAD